jgi:hypothetical protein
MELENRSSLLLITSAVDEALESAQVSSNIITLE